VDGVYRERHTVSFGKSLPLPEPVGFDLDTEPLAGRTAPDES
jgi:hypothetical protein